MSNTVQSTLETSLDGKELTYNGICKHFDDKVLLIATPTGKIGHMLKIDPLRHHGDELNTGDEFSLLPTTSLTPSWLLGSSEGSARGEFVSFVAIQTASLLSAAGHRKSLTIGLTLPGSERFWAVEKHADQRAEFFQIITEFLATLTMKGVPKVAQ